MFINQIPLDTLLGSFSNLLNVSQLFFCIIVIVMFCVDKPIIIEMRSKNKSVRKFNEYGNDLHEIADVVDVLLLLGLLYHLLLFIGNILI